MKLLTHTLTALGLVLIPERKPWNKPTLTLVLVCTTLRNTLPWGGVPPKSWATFSVEVSPLQDILAVPFQVLSGPFFLPGLPLPSPQGLGCMSQSLTSPLLTPSC